MKKRLFSTITGALLLIITADAQISYDWGVGLGSTGTDQGRCATLEGNNTVVTTGIFDGTVDFDAGAGTTSLTNSGGTSDMYVTIYNSVGSFLSVMQIAGSGVEIPRYLIDDDAGNFYITGRFTGTADFDPSGSTTSLSAAGSDDIFLINLASSGSLVWANRIGGTGSDQGWGVAFASDGNILVCGHFSGTVDFDPSASTANLSSAGGTDIFLAKYNASTGAYIWAENIGGSSNDRATSISDDGSGNIYLCGLYAGTVDMDPGAGTDSHSSAAGSADIFVNQYTSTGGFNWSVTVGASGNDGALDLAVYSGDVYVTGGIGQGTVDFDPSAGTTSMTNSGSGLDAFLVKYTSAGNFSWLVPLASSGPDLGQAVRTDANGYIYVSGNFSNTIDFDPSGSTANQSSNGGLDLFVARYNSSGTYKTANGFGSSAGDDEGPGLAINGSLGLIYLTGYFTNTVNFDPSGTANLTASGQDIYILRYSWTSPLRNAASLFNGSSNPYPNPSTGIIYFDALPENAVVEIYSSDGKKAGSWISGSQEISKLDLSSFENGIYLIRVITAEGSVQTEKLILQH